MGDLRNQPKLRLPQDAAGDHRVAIRCIPRRVDLACLATPPDGAAAMKSRHQDGFTLLEMIIVLVILGLILAMVAGLGPMHSARMDTEAAARELASLA